MHQLHLTIRPAVRRRHFFACACTTPAIPNPVDSIIRNSFESHVPAKVKCSTLLPPENQTPQSFFPLAPFSSPSSQQFKIIWSNRRNPNPEAPNKDNYPTLDIVSKTNQHQISHRLKKHRAKSDWTRLRSGVVLAATWFSRLIISVISQEGPRSWDFCVIGGFASVTSIRRAGIRGNG